MPDHPSALHACACRNCCATLQGPYCAQCGQHAHESARSLHTLLHDIWHLLTHVDGTLWSTLKLLLFRPGLLTVEYFADRRARYMPPFRLYFVISVLFFALAALTTSVSNTMTPARGSMSAADRADVGAALSDPEVPAALRGTVTVATQSTLDATQAAQLCSTLGSAGTWAGSRLQAVCRHQLADQGKTMLHAFGAMVPKMMFVFLPLMALVMLALYHSPARFYVEHLVFLLHLQSALFLAMMLKLLLTTLTDVLPVLAPVANLIGVALFGYALWYAYAAMHRFYAQSRRRTLVKFAALLGAYTICFGLSLAGTLVLSALVT